MESKEYITYSRRAKAVERPQQPLVKTNQFHGYRSTKQWVEETSQRCRGGSIEKAEQQQQQRHFQSEEAARGLNVTPCRATRRKKDGRGVHFKQENDQTLSRLECKGGEQPSSLVQLAMVRKDGFPDGQAAALSPISLNVAGGGRQMANLPVPGKYSPVVATLPKGVTQTHGQISVNSPDGREHTLPSESDEEGRHVVWCNAAFEADDDLRSQDSARNNRNPPASCSANVQDGPVMVPSMNQKQQDQRAWASGIGLASANHSAIFSQETDVSFKPDNSSANAVARNSSATVLMKSPVQDSRLLRPARLELESTAGEWCTPMGSEESSQNSRVFTQGNDRPREQSKTRRNLAATPSFKTVPQTPTHPNRHVPGARARSSSCSNPRKYPVYCTDVHSNSNSYSNPRGCISHDNGPRSAKRAGGAPSVLVGKGNPLVFSPPRNRAPKITRFQDDPVVEADLEADIEQEIEQEISMEILQLSERLATLHAKQETRRVGAGGEERSKAGGISCPQTPMRNAPSPCGSDTAKGKRKGRVVAAKFLQYNNDGSNAKRDKSVNRTERSAAKFVGFSDGPFLGRPNPPRRSLGTPSRLLTKGKPNGQQRSGSPNHMVRENMVEEQFTGMGRKKVTSDEYVRSTAMMDSGSRRVVRVLSHRNLGDDNRKDWNDRGIVQSNNKNENQLAPTLCTGPIAVQSNFYPEFERKVDWVKTLRTDPIPAAHPCEVMNSPAPALDEKFLKQKSERQDVNAWLRENIGIAGNCELSNFTPHHAPSTGVYERGLQGAAGQADLRKVRMVEEEDSTNSCSTRPSNGWTFSLSNARPATPSRCTPNPPTTPSRCNGRTVPSRYGTPVKAVLSRAPGSNKCLDTKPILESSGAKQWYRQTTPSKRHSKDTKAGLRKASPTNRKGYPAESAARNGLKDERGVVNNDAEATTRERKITIVGGSEYEKFIQEGVAIEKRVPAVCKNIVVDGGAQRCQAVNQGGRSRTSSLIKQRDICQPPSSDLKAAKKIFIRCSDLIKDKHSLLVKGKQRRFAGQGGVLPSDSEDSVFARSETRTDLAELGEDNSRSDEASIIEESKCMPSSRLSQRRAVGGVQQGVCMNSCEGSEKSSLTPDYDIVYDYESGNARASSYRPEDYTLEMMLQYVDTLQCERQALPRIRAVKDFAPGNSSPRDSGCIKRRREGEKRNRFYFNAGGEANKVQVPKYPSIENDGLLPNEIEGLDLESFWCLVGELGGPIII